MSTRDDARLTAQERAALASLEAVAAADDPKLASRLRGTGKFRRVFRSIRLPVLPPWARTRWWGVPIVVLGLLFVVLGLSVAWALGVIGAVIAAAGLYLLAVEADTRWRQKAPDSQ